MSNKLYRKEYYLARKELRYETAAEVEELVEVLLSYLLHVYPHHRASRRYLRTFRNVHNGIVCRLRKLAKPGV